MIQERIAQSTILEEGKSQGTIGMSLDMDSAQVLMQMLSKNLYSDPIGSSVRECASNALDSHRRAGVTEAIIVSLKVNDESNYEFSVEDFGTGLDADDVENIISKYGKSTKRESNTEIGMMGLGFKSPLAYSSSFYFICRKDGIERKYMMYEGEDVNTIDLLFEIPTEERNGVKVIIPVKFQDRWVFHEKIQEQLSYFESVYFDVNVQNNIITNEFNIHRAEHFQISEMNQDSSIHICLDNVYYPLDFAKLGIVVINLPIGLRFGLGDGLFPTPNREQLIYTSQAKKTIVEKLALVATALVDKYNETNLDCKDIHEIFNYYSGTIRNITIGNTIIDTFKLKGHSTSQFQKPTYANYTLTNFDLLYKNRDYLFYEYKVQQHYVRGQFRQVNTSWESTLQYNSARNIHRIFTYDEGFVGNKKSYIKSLLPLNSYEEVKFMRKTKEFSLFNKDRNHTHDNYMTLLNLRAYPKDTWRARIKEFQDIIHELTKDYKHVDSITIPQAWLDARKKKRVSTANGGTRRVKLQGEISGKFADELQRYVNGKSSKLTPTVIKVAEISSQPLLQVYGRSKDETLIDQLYSVNGKQKIKYFVLSEREYKVAESLDLHNLISIETFMAGKTKPFRRIVTGWLIHKMMKQYRFTFEKLALLSPISKSLYDDLKALEDYRNNNYVSTGGTEIFDAMEVIAEKHNLYDETVYPEYKHIKELLDGFPFINTILGMMPYVGSDADKLKNKEVLTDLFKYHKIRIDYTNYKLVLNTEEVTI